MTGKCSESGENRQCTTGDPVDPLHALERNMKTPDKFSLAAMAAALVCGAITFVLAWEVINADRRTPETPTARQTLLKATMASLPTDATRPAPAHAARLNPGSSPRPPSP